MRLFLASMLSFVMLFLSLSIVLSEVFYKFFVADMFVQIECIIYAENIQTLQEETNKTNRTYFFLALILSRTIVFSESFFPKNSLKRPKLSTPIGHSFTQALHRTHSTSSMGFPCWA